VLAFVDLAEDPVAVGCEGVAWDRDYLLLCEMNKLSLYKIWCMIWLWKRGMVKREYIIVYTNMLNIFNTVEYIQIFNTVKYIQSYSLLIHFIIKKIYY